jgi:hypothetical protein
VEGIHRHPQGAMYFMVRGEMERERERERER